MNQRTAVYRFFGFDDRLLYVGMTADPNERFATHARKAEWWPLAGRHQIDWYESRAEAHTNEVLAIETENPQWNSSGRGSGRPPTGKTPIRQVRIGDVWDECTELAADGGETMTALVTRLLHAYVEGEHQEPIK